VIGDERGIILELVDARTDYWHDPIPYMYLGTCRPGKAKGWGMHDDHIDRYMIISGEMLLVLFDDRPDSLTTGVVQEFYLTMEGRNQITIPTGVWHAHMNLGTADLVFLNAPTEPFDHANPDKHTLPLDTDKIPYTFFTGLGR
jgi:dTDP-4-dehydrorhamnose 3,5-epimerase